MRTFLLVGLGLCLFMGNTTAEDTVDEQLNELYRQYTEQFLSYLETSQHEQLRVASAIWLLQTDGAAKNTRGMKLISDALNNPGIDPTSLWWIALDCRWRATAEWCESGEALARLQQADPGNAAIQVFKLSNEKQALSDDEKQQLLAMMADAERYEVYWAKGVDKAFEEALAYVELNEAPPDPINAPIKLTPDINAFTLAIYFFTTSSIASTTPPYKEIVDLCREQAEQQDSDGKTNCKKLARIMQQNSDTILSRMIGFEIEKSILKAADPDDPKIHAIDLRKNTDRLMMRCSSPLWVNHVERWPSIETARMMNYWKNLDELGEWEGYKVTLQQEYGIAPEGYPVNPAECNAILEMDDASLDKFFAGRSVSQVWEQMQADAKAKSQE